MGAHAHLLVGALAHSGRWRGQLAESEDFPHLVQALDLVVRKLGGTARRWRFDRMSTVCYPSSGQVTAAFASVAKYYGVGVDICPSRRGNRKGVVEKTNHSAAQRWWRTVPDALTVEQAQSGVDKLALRMDDRRRRFDGMVTTVAELAAAEPLLKLPDMPFPAELEAERTVTPQGLILFEGNSYSVPPGLAGARVRVVHRLGEDYLHVMTAGRAVVARHRRAPRGAGRTPGTPATLSPWSKRSCRASTTGLRVVPRSAVLRRKRPSRRRTSCTRSRPPGPRAERVVIDLSHYAAVADRLRHCSPSKEEESEE